MRCGVPSHARKKSIKTGSMPSVCSSVPPGVATKYSSLAVSTRASCMGRMGRVGRPRGAWSRPSTTDKPRGRATEAYGPFVAEYVPLDPPQAGNSQAPGQRALNGRGRCLSSNTESGRGFEPFVDEKGDCVAISEPLRPTEHMSRLCGASGCERGSWTDADAPAPSWVWSDRTGLGGGSRGTLSSLRDDEGSALTEAAPIDQRSIVDDAARSRSDARGGPKAADIP